MFGKSFKIKRAPRNPKAETSAALSSIKLVSLRSKKKTEGRDVMCIRTRNIVLRSFSREKIVNMIVKKAVKRQPVGRQIPTEQPRYTPVILSIERRVGGEKLTDAHTKLVDALTAEKGRNCIGGGKRKVVDTENLLLIDAEFSSIMSLVACDWQCVCKPCEMTCVSFFIFRSVSFVVRILSFVF